MNSLTPDLLERVKGILKNEVNPQSYQTWFSPIKWVDSSEENITLEVPNKFFKDWITERYLHMIENAFEKCANKKVSIQLVTSKQTHHLYQRDSVSLPSRSSGFSLRDAGLNPRYTFDGFVIGPSNRFAHAASLAVSESPAKAYNPLFIYGGVGLGKTHLMQAIGNRLVEQNKTLKVLYISSEHFTNQLISAIQNRTTIKFRQLYRGVDVLLIDDIHFIAGKESTQEEFFHTFNTLHDAHKQIVISSDRSPKDISGLEERLVSRFGWGLVTDIQPPNLETRIAILRKKAEKETIPVPNDVTFYIAERIKSNIRELEGALIRVVAYAKLIGKEVNIELVKEVLKDMVLEDEVKVSVELIQKKVAGYFNIKFSDLKSKKRNKTIVYPRQIAMFLARDLTGYSLPEIGSFFGGRNHTTVLHACEKIGKLLKKDAGLKHLLNRLVEEIRV